MKLFEGIKLTDSIEVNASAGDESLKKSWKGRINLKAYLKYFGWRMPHFSYH